MSYDSKAVKIPKAIKIQAATMLDPVLSHHFIKLYVKIEEGKLRTKFNPRAKVSLADPVSE